MNLQSLHVLLQPLLDGDLPAWQGLPPAPVAAFDALFGAPSAQGTEPLGARPALRSDYAGALTLWSRGGLAVMAAPAKLPPDTVLQALGPPDLVLPHEILLPGHYAHEYLYGRRGLLLTVAEVLQGSARQGGARQGDARQGGARHVARCRGMAPLAAPQDLGSDLYLAFEDRVAWAAPGEAP
ncbi:hypothetical protein [Pseudorhodoferax sp.]|uniref:hypothetical protein n=1 Tax=Pseudorhodoferax sp. TaxID=1993553 RepID=UPI0039E669F8